MTLYFITGNKHKFEEIKSMLPQIEHLDLDLPEVQDIDPKAIIKAKLIEALNHKQSEFIVEDTSLYLDCLNGLPGPFIKWFLKTVGNQGLSTLAERLGDRNAEAKTIIGYAKSPEEIYYFEGSIKGTIIEPIGKSSFGWDPIFQPEGYTKSFAEFTREEKNAISMRKNAATQLRAFMEK